MRGRTAAPAAESSWSAYEGFVEAFAKRTERIRVGYTEVKNVFFSSE
jgi:hypothetical protein